MKATAEMTLDTEKTMKLEQLQKNGSECELNSWPDTSAGSCVGTEVSGRGIYTQVLVQLGTPTHLGTPYFGNVCRYQ